MSASPTSHSGIQVRLAGPADVVAMVPVVNAAFAIETFLVGPRTDNQNMVTMMENGEFLLAQDSSSHVVACVYIELRGETGYFGMLAVDPAQQGKGLGRTMVEAAEHHCRRHGCKQMEIAVLSLRTELPPFYRSMGYLESGTQEFRPARPLKDGVECHAIVMRKNL